MSAENVVIGSQFMFIIGFSFLLTEFAVLFQQARHFSGELNVAVASSGFRLLDDDILASTGVPGNIGGYTVERIIRAPAADCSGLSPKSASE